MYYPKWAVLLTVAAVGWVAFKEWEEKSTIDRVPVIGATYCSVNENPFDPVTCVKVLEVRGKYVKYNYGEGWAGLQESGPFWRFNRSYPQQRPTVESK